MTRPFTDFDPADFWEQSSYANAKYVGDPLTPEKVQAVEQALSYRLPRSYVALMEYQNGGIPKRKNHRTREPTSWATDHVAIAGIYAIGNERSCSLCGAFGSDFWVKAWGYPPIGVYFADCPSAGHDMLCLDYRACGPDGEPTVVHVDQEFDYKITFVAENFEAFINSLEPDDFFDFDE